MADELDENFERQQAWAREYAQRCEWCRDTVRASVPDLVMRRLLGATCSRILKSPDTDRGVAYVFKVGDLVWDTFRALITSRDGDAVFDLEIARLCQSGDPVVVGSRLARETVMAEITRFRDAYSRGAAQ